MADNEDQQRTSRLTRLAARIKPPDAASESHDAPVKLPRRRLGATFLREAWWGLFCDLIMATVDDADALHLAANDASRTVDSARTLADAAIDEFEQRWVE